jgi:hypothetical protein
MWHEPALAVFVFGVACTAAFAGPPFFTDDPEPVDLHHLELNVIGQQTRAVSGRAGSVSGEVNAGCAAETQCHLALPVSFNGQAGGGSHAGLGDVELGVNIASSTGPTTAGPLLSIPPWTCPQETPTGVLATDARSSCCRYGYNGPPANGAGTLASLG